jgi:hypothetical protein
MIKNPEKEYRTTPARFSEESKIVKIEKYDSKRGIILDTLDEFKQALISYGDNTPTASRAMYHNLIEGFGHSDDEMDSPVITRPDMCHLSSDRVAGLSFVEKVAEEATAELKSEGKFYKNFHYDGLGTAFFKTTIDAKRIGGKYILALMSPYTNPKTEDELAASLGKNMAIANARVKAKLSVVDDWWFNLNIESTLRKFPITTAIDETDPKLLLRSWPNHLVYCNCNGCVSPELSFKHNHRRFGLTIGLDANMRLVSEGESIRYTQLRGHNIVGGAWTNYAKNGRDRISPRIAQPSIVATVCLPRERSERPLAIRSEDINAIHQARDYIATLFPTSR